MVHGAKERVLRVRNTDYMTVKMLKTGLVLCAEDLQDSPPKMYMMRRSSVQDQRKQFALICKYKTDYYSLKVAETTLELEMVDHNNWTKNFSSCHWFEKVKQSSSNEYHLRTVVEPAKYLAVTDTQFFVTHDDQNCALITEE